MCIRDSYKGDYYGNQADGNRLRRTKITAPRGLFFDYKGQELVNNLPGYADVYKRQVLMAIAVAASCAFASPVGTPPNTLVLGPGGYKFMDYVKAGTGLVIVSFIVSLVVIPIVWPFFPGN